jgi:hypothetical protein
MEPSQTTGEIVVAVLGLETLLSPKMRALTQEQKETILRFPDLLRRSVYRVLAGSRPKKSYRTSEFSFKRVSKILSQRGDVAARHMQEVLPTDVLPSVGMVLGRLVDVLYADLPRNIRSTLGGLSEDIEQGSDTDLQKYQTLWEVANDPLIVLHHLSDGELTHDEVTALELFYPSLYATIRTFVLQAIPKIKADRPKWDPDNDDVVGSGLRKLLQTQDSELGLMISTAFTGDSPDGPKMRMRLPGAKAVSLATSGQT